MTDLATREMTTKPKRGLAGGIATALAVAIAVVFADRASKNWASSSLGDGHVRHIIWTLRLGLYYNGGMAFGRGEGKGPLIALAVLAVLGGLAWSLRHPRSRLYTVSAGLVIGGGIGNLIDRFLKSDNGFMTGRVVDFIDFQWWPAFNVADMGVVVGAILLMLDSWHRGRLAKAAS
jgi:signal peptidase II